MALKSIEKYICIFSALQNYGIDILLLKQKQKQQFLSDINILQRDSDIEYNFLML